MSTRDILVLILAVIALVFSIFDVVRSQGQALLAWAGVLLAAALIVIVVVK